MARTWKTLELSKELRGANENQIGVFSARDIVGVKRAVKAAPAVFTNNVQNGGHSSDMFVVGLDENVSSNFSAKATLRKASVEMGDQSAFKEAAADCVLAG